MPAARCGRQPSAPYEQQDAGLVDDVVSGALRLREGAVGVVPVLLELYSDGRCWKIGIPRHGDAISRDVVLLPAIFS